MRIFTKIRLYQKTFHNPNKFGQGFSLVETLIALALLLSVISGTLVVSSQSLSLANSARYKVTAFYLAQEPVEYIRALRDSHRIENIQTAPTPLIEWLQDLDDCYSPGSCTIDILSGSVVACDVLCPILKFNNNTGEYGYGTGVGWVDSEFTRVVTINERVVDQEADITVVVSWVQGSNIRTYTLKEAIFNW